MGERWNYILKGKDGRVSRMMEEEFGFSVCVWRGWGSVYG